MSGILGHFKDRNDGLALSGASAGASHDNQSMRPAPANIASASVSPVREGAGRPGSMTSSKPAPSSSSNSEPYQSPAQQLARERAAAAKAQIAARRAMEAERIPTEAASQMIRTTPELSGALSNPRSSVLSPLQSTMHRLWQP